jgi:hypothetical protein
MVDIYVITKHNIEVMWQPRSQGFLVKKALGNEVGNVVIVSNDFAITSTVRGIIEYQYVY